MERRESDREEGWGIRRTIYPGGGGLGRMLSVLLQPLWAWHGGRKLSCCGWMPLWPDPFCVPPILTWESFCGKSPNGFYVSDLCPQNIGWHSPHLPKKKKKKGETLTHSSGRYFGRSEQWGVWNTPEGNPGQHSSVASRAVAFWMRVPVRKEKWGQGWVGVGGARDSKSLNKPQKCHGLGAGWKRISRHETIRVWFFSFCILRPSLVLSALHSLGNHNLGRKNHFNYLVYALYLSDCFYQSLESAREITKNQ